MRMRISGTANELVQVSCSIAASTVCNHVHALVLMAPNLGICPHSKRWYLLHAGTSNKAFLAV